MLNSRLRSQDPVTQVQLYDGTKAWIVMRHKDICSVLASEDLSANRRHPGYPEIHEGGHAAKEARPTFVNLDNPEHDQQRNMLQAAFEPDAVEKLRPMIQSVVNRNIDKLLSEGQAHQPVDLMEHFANKVPTEVIFHMLGIPDDEVESLAKDSELRHSTSRNAAESSNKNLQTRMQKLVEQRIDNPQDDLVSKLVKEQYQQGKLSKEDIVNLAFLVLTAGNAALLNSIGLGVITLLQHPDQLAAFKKYESLAPTVVNELLRFNTVSALNSRRATNKPIHIGNQQIEEDTGVICSVQSGDRDRLDANESDPESFDIYRKRDPKSVLAFGYGPHRCQAETLSRVELDIAFTTLFKRLPNLRLAKDVDELEYPPAEQNAGVLSLPVLF
ncbi:hypothetical protein E8E11_000537 [Didymella keratinophila]|nr:hypothetical protein E8E11_000537 [Didymella keratinophila]